MEPRDVDKDGGHLLVDYSGNTYVDTGKRHGQHSIVIDPKQEKEMANLDQETRLFRAMNEIRELNAKNLDSYQRQMFVEIAEGIFKKHGITPEFYRTHLSRLGTPQTLRR